MMSTGRGSSRSGFGLIMKPPICRDIVGEELLHSEWPCGCVEHLENACGSGCGSKVLHHPHVGTQVPVIDCKMATVRRGYGPWRRMPAQPLTISHVPLFD